MTLFVSILNYIQNVNLPTKVGSCSVTLGILGGMGYVVYKHYEDQQGQTAQPVSYTVTTKRDLGGVAKNTFLGSIGASLVESNGGAGGGLLDLIFGGRRGNAGSTKPTTTSPVINKVNTPPSAPKGGGNSHIGDILKRDLMFDFGFTNNQAAGIVGNLHVESAGFKTLQEIQPMQYVNGKLVPSKTARGGYGYAQWTGPRRRAFEAWANDKGYSTASYAANYGFLKHEMTNTGERRVVARVKATQTVDQATKVFMQTFLRPGIPHLSSRISNARKYA